MLLNYIREKIVTNIYLFITARMRRVHTPMQQVIMQLKQKGFWHFGGVPLWKCLVHLDYGIQRIMH